MKRDLNYGTIAPARLKAFLWLGATALFVGLVAAFAGEGWLSMGGWFLLFAGFSLLVASALQFLYTRIGKIHHRDVILGLMPWRGHERVLDIGTGLGLLLIGAAKHLTSGHATGIDIWRARDLADNSPEACKYNVEAERVSHRVDVMTMDAQKLDFPDEEFDVILSNLCLRNLPGKAARRQACEEMVRVLKPGGFAFVSDLKYTRECADILSENGLVVERTSPQILKTFLPLRIVKAIKPK